MCVCVNPLGGILSVNDWIPEVWNNCQMNRNNYDTFQGMQHIFISLYWMNKSDTVDVKWKRVDGLKKVFILHDFSINLSYVLIYFWFDTIVIHVEILITRTTIRQQKVLLRFTAFVDRKPTRSKFYKDTYGSYL